MTSESGASVGRFLLKKIPANASHKAFFQSYVVSAQDQAILEAAAVEDSYRYAYNGVISFLGALAGLYKNQAAWAVTKLYYTAFYLARASLCRRRFLAFHVPCDGKSGHTQYELTVAAGQRATASKVPGTHKLIADSFRKMGYPPHMEGLTVDGIDPMKWLVEQREFWQYRAGRFPDPELPGCLIKIDASKLQRHLTTYEEDKLGVYISDPDHALVAIPFRLVTWTLSESPLADEGILGREQVAHLRMSCTIGKQQLNVIRRQL